MASGCLLLGRADAEHGPERAALPNSSAAAALTGAARGSAEALPLDTAKPSRSAAAPGTAWQRQTGSGIATAEEATIDWHAGWESGGSDWDGPLADVRSLIVQRPSVLASTLARLFACRCRVESILTAVAHGATRPKNMSCSISMGLVAM